MNQYISPTLTETSTKNATAIDPVIWFIVSQFIIAALGVVASIGTAVYCIISGYKLVTYFNLYNGDFKIGCN